MFDQWQVQKQVIIQLYADVYLYSSLPEEMVCKAKFFPTNSIEQTLLKLQKKYGENMTIAVLPQGPLTIPYIRNIK
jgi:nickel-dependent lactate racemase